MATPCPHLRRCGRRCYRVTLLELERSQFVRPIFIPGCGGASGWEPCGSDVGTGIRFLMGPGPANGPFVCLPAGWRFDEEISPWQSA
ncbi:hypothetical protein GCM10010442_49930 [Kitasatospora kifunensis]